MPRPARPWFRFYVEAVWDRKLRTLPPASRWCFVAILSLARASAEPGVLLIGRLPANVADIADAAALSAREVTAALERFELAGMLTKRCDGAWRVVAWDERQYESDSSTLRTAKHRSNNVAETFSGTVPETEADTETENNARAPSRRKPRTTAPPGFTISEELAEWGSREVPGLDLEAATKRWLTAMHAGGYRYSDWSMAWRNGMRNQHEWTVANVKR